MGKIDVAATMDALAEAFADVPVITACHGLPVEALKPGEACVLYPDTIDFDVTFGRGADEAVFHVLVVCGLVTDTSTRTYASTVIGSVADVKASVDGTLGGVVQVCTVTDAQVVRIDIGGVQNVAVDFACDITS